MDKDLKPHGIVRAIDLDGNFFEGAMTPNGVKNGWGIFYNTRKLMVPVEVVST